MRLKLTTNLKDKEFLDHFNSLWNDNQFSPLFIEKIIYTDIDGFSIKIFKFKR